MQNHSENTKRIAKNTLMLYIRMMFGMLVSLYTTRVILDVLGVSDYGIYNLVGGVVGLMGMVTGLLSQGTSRFITIALGKNSDSELNGVFSASVTIHLILAIFILILGELIGPYVINKLNIPTDRMGAAQFVFQLSLLSSIIGIIQSPFNAAIMAHERMTVYAYISIWDVLAKLGIVYLLQVINIDKLKLYSILFFLVGLITTTVYLAYCRNNFYECRTVALKPDKELYKKIFNYTGWNAIGSLALTMSGQGITILLSTFGTVVNAARGIAGNVSRVVFNFVNNFQSAARPQIVKLYAVKDYSGMNNLIARVSKFSAYLMGLIGVPLFLEMEYILELWLKEVPEYTVTFARLTLIQGLIQSLDIPIGIGIHAVGKMKLPNLTSAFIYMLILPVSYIAIKLGASPEIAYVLVICVYPLALLMDLYILGKYTGFPIWNFIVKVMTKSIIIMVFTAFVVDIVICRNIDIGLRRVVLTTLVSSILCASLIFTWGLSHNERVFIKNILVNRLRNTSKS